MPLLIWELVKRTGYLSIFFLPFKSNKIIVGKAKGTHVFKRGIQTRTPYYALATPYSPSLQNTPVCDSTLIKSKLVQRREVFRNYSSLC